MPMALDIYRYRSLVTNEFNLAWEDLSGGGDSDFNDIVFTAKVNDAPQPQGVDNQGECRT
jgi:hypothetical protein